MEIKPALGSEITAGATILRQMMEGDDCTRFGIDVYIGDDVIRGISFFFSFKDIVREFLEQSEGWLRQDYQLDEMEKQLTSLAKEVAKRRSKFKKRD